MTVASTRKRGALPERCLPPRSSADGDAHCLGALPEAVALARVGGHGPAHTL